MKSLITNIQRFCVSDGPGIRTTVFFKGCSLHCPWCANPENIKAEQQIYYVREKCSERCSYSYLCKAYHNNVPEETDIQHCNYRAVEYVGKYYSQEQLFNELVKDRKYFEPMGGITFSGGEPLLFLPYYKKMLQKLKLLGISICIETALFVPTEFVQQIIPFIDNYYVDLKILTPNECKTVIGGEVSLYFNNLAMLYSMVSREQIIYRFPIVPGMTDSINNLENIYQTIEKYPPHHVEIFSVHNLGKSKYKMLNVTMPEFPAANEDEINKIKDRIELVGIKVVINRL